MIFKYNHPTLKPRRKELRKQQTDVEELLWKNLRSKQLEHLKFYRQYSIGPYVVDFYCAEKRLAIELDGGHHTEPTVKEYDEGRTDYLKMHDIQVLRFWNDDVLKNIDGVLQKILGGG